MAEEWRAPVDVDAALDGMTATLRRFGIKRVTGDRYAAGFVLEAFKRRGIAYTVPEKPSIATGESSYM